MTPEQRSQLIHLLQANQEIPPEWARTLFPPEKREYELVYQSKEREEDIIADTLAVPLQAVRTFNTNGVEWHNKLIFGDNLQVMKRLLEMKRAGELLNADGTPGVRLVYIDPPFATRRDFKGTEDQKAYQDRVIGADFLEFVRRRLLLIRELLSEDGVVFVHTDWKKGHYLKVLMDEIFGESRFKNEIIWWYYNKMQGNVGRFPSNHESILFYARGPRFHFEAQYAERELGPSRLLKRVWNGATKKLVNARDKDGNLIYFDSEDSRIDDVWRLSMLQPADKTENLGYPTQKPETLLAPIISATSKEGDVVLDAFAGSGTTCAVAEKLGRRWIGIDCGKLAIYTIQKRMLNLRKNIGNDGAALKAKPFTLYNAGLYDFARLKDLPWDEWRRFALTLFGCRDELHKIGGIRFDGTLKGAPVQVFDHRQHGGAIVTEDTLRSIHQAVHSRIGSRMFVIAPSLAFDFQQDYIQLDETRYYALRIPYSIIHELHHRDFIALKQPMDELAVNDTVDAVGFDFIRTPDMDYSVGSKGGSAFIRIERFFSEAALRESSIKRANRETLSMVMLDYDYDANADVFNLDEVFYKGGIEAADWKVVFSASAIGEHVMAVFVDIYGNEARVVMPASAFGTPVAKVSKASTPVAKVSKASTPVAKVSKASTPVAKVSKASTPVAKVSKASTPVAKVSKASTPVAKVSKASTPVAKASKASTPVAKAAVKASKKAAPKKARVAKSAVKRATKVKA